MYYTIVQMSKESDKTVLDSTKVRISETGQFTVPKKWRDVYERVDGAELDLVLEDGEVKIELRCQQLVPAEPVEETND